MNVEPSLVQLIDEKTYSWRLGRRDSNCRWESKLFSICGNLNSFCFLIQPNYNGFESGRLYLCERSQSEPEFYCLQILLKYKSRTITLPVKHTRKSLKLGEWNMHYLGDIRIRYLFEVTCKFFNAEETSESPLGRSKFFYFH